MGVIAVESKFPCVRLITGLNELLQHVLLSEWCQLILLTRRHSSNGSWRRVRYGTQIRHPRPHKLSSISTGKASHSSFLPIGVVFRAGNKIWSVFMVLWYYIANASLIVLV